MPALNPRWALRHAWHGSAERDALALCRAALGAAGIALADARPDETPCAVKLHGMEMVDALAIHRDALADLAGVARAGQWARRLPGFVQRFMVHGERLHGIPIGVHRANALWVNEAVARRIGGEPPHDLRSMLAWLDAASSRVAAPLALGSEPWQIGVLFESVLLAEAGVAAYCRAFVRHDPSVWGEPATGRAIASLMQLRNFVGEPALSLPWHGQFERVRTGEAAVQVMGDWARVGAGPGVLEWAAPGTAGWFVAIVDFFVPLAGGSAAASERAAAALTAAPFQAAFSRAKGCLPAVRDAWGLVDPQRARSLAVEAMVLPSFTFDQCCAAVRRQALLAVVAEAFLARWSVPACTRALAELTHEFQLNDRKDMP